MFKKWGGVCLVQYFALAMRYSCFLKELTVTFLAIDNPKKQHPPTF